MNDVILMLVVVPGVFGGWAVAYALSIRTSRELAHQGWFRTKTSIQVVSVPVFFAGFGLTALVVDALDLSEGRLIDWVLVDAVMVGSMLLVGSVTVWLTKRLPAPARSGPRAALNDALARRLRQAGRWSPVLILLLPIPYWFYGYGVAAELFVIALTAIAVLWLRGLLLRASDRLETHDVLAMHGLPLILYIRPFDDEHRLFGADGTFEEFFAERATSVGRLVALGYPGDRIPPAGAMRSYYSDEEWKIALDELARTARCIVGMVTSSTSTTWELGRIRELCRQQSLYLLTAPPTSQRRPGPLRRVAALVNAWLSNDMPYFTRLLAFGAPPLSSEPAAQASWAEFSRTLNSLGYSVGTNDPGPGSVLSFDADGRMRVLASGAIHAEEYLATIADSSGGGSR